MTTIGTTTNANATRWWGQRKLLFAADGTSCAIYQDGTDLVFRAASSPYASWGSAVTIQASGQAEADAIIAGDDTIDVVYKKSGNANLGHRRMTKSGASWTVGSEHLITGSANDFGSGGEILRVCRDVSDRLWVAYFQWVGSYSWEAQYSTDNGSTWNSSITGGTGGIEQHNLALFSAGNYVVVVTSQDGNLKWRRCDTTGTLTTWTAAQSSNQGFYGDHKFSSAMDGSGIVVLAAQPNNSTDYAIRTCRYDSGSDTWGNQVDIGASASDRSPSVVVAGSSVAAAWAKYSASNDYSVVYKLWDGAAWGTETEIVACGANRTYISAGWDGSGVAAIWTEGTGSPYDVVFVTTGSGAPAGAVHSKFSGASKLQGLVL